MMVDFEMVGRAIRGLPKAQQRWVAKSVAGFLPYGTNMKRWKLRQEDSCPQCQQQAESKAHLTQFQAMEAIQNWTTAIEQLEQWLISAHTAPDIQHKILDGLRTWQKGENTENTPRTFEAAKEQNTLGWNLAMEGCLSKKWQAQQEAYGKVFRT